MVLFSQHILTDFLPAGSVHFNRDVLKSSTIIADLFVSPVGLSVFFSCTYYTSSTFLIEFIL